MLELFYKRNGAISVFLSLILLPVLIFGFLTTDAARIYFSKVVISDAGEMAMNAALTQYEEALHDQYGLLAMEKTAESMESELEGFFNTTLNGTGISGVSGYERILDLMTQSFDAIDVANTEIYRTEVEKQQILEYMKYRAPVCLTELVIEKIGFIKDTKAFMEATDKQIDFAEAMEDCQDAFQDALNALNTLNATIESFPDQNTIQTELDTTQMDYKTTVSRCLLMYAALQNYSDKPSGKTIEEMAKSYIAAAKKVDIRNPYSETSYSNYRYALYYDNGILNAGKIDKMISDHDKEEPSDPESPEYETWAEKREDLVELKNDYSTCKSRISSYMQTLLNCANSYVSTHYAKLNGYYTKAKTAAEQADRAYKKLETVREKLLQAQNAYNEWDAATSRVDKDIVGDMKNQVEEYREFFGDDMQDLYYLETSVRTDKEYFTDIRNNLQNEKFFNKSIATTAASTQTNHYRGQWETYIKNKNTDYTNLETIRTNNCDANYNHITISAGMAMQRIKDDAFYKRLQEYCKKTDTSESKEEAKKGSQNLDSGSETAKEAEKTDTYPTYDWSSAAQKLPSTALGVAGFTQADSSLTGLASGTDVSSKSSRRNAIAKMRDSIKSANSFLDGVDKIIENNLENLYIAEYAMQMFSYYTCDKKMQADKTLKTLSEDENISISGYKLSKNKAYKAEAEYILWGNSSSAQNVKNTVMLLFGIRLLFNSIYAFTNNYVNSVTTTAAGAIAGAAPYLVPIIKIALKFGIAAVETAEDISRLKAGYGVAIVKTEESFKTISKKRGDVRNGVTFDYGEYMRVFLNVKMIAGQEVKMLARIGDCIQVNTDTDVTKDFTMVSVQAKVTTRTTFMRKIADWSGAGWEYDDNYSINYQSILGY